MKLLAAATAALILSGCGYIGAPMYPLLNIPTAVTDLAAVQRGAAIIYQFTLPPLTTEGKQARIGQVELRAGESAGASNANEWAAHAAPVPVAFAHQRRIRSEIPAAAWIGKDLTIGVKVHGANGRDAGWSNLVTVAVVKPLTQPSGVRAAAVAEGVRVSWTGPAGSYKVFRRVEPETAFALMTTVEATEWIDKGIEYGKKFEYEIQAVMKAAAGEAESELSEAAPVTPVDTFPPAVPSGLNAIAANEGIELVWERNTESDLSGYWLYRSAGDGKLEKIAEIQGTPSYSDRKVESGKVYRYAVASVDLLGNYSKPSDPVEITAP